jgi:hypothetical protein
MQWGTQTWRSDLTSLFPQPYLPQVGRDTSVGIATVYMLDGPGIEFRWEARFSAPVQTGPGVHPASSTMGTGSFPGVTSCRVMTLTPHPLLVPWSWKGRAIPLLPLWAVRPVQSLNACTRVTFTFTFYLLHFTFYTLVQCTDCRSFYSIPDQRVSEQSAVYIVKVNILRV